MKRIFIFTFLIIFLASCTKELNQVPISDATTVAFYKSANDFLQGVNAIYAPLRSYPDRAYNLSETRSDNLYAVSEGGVRDWEGINSFHQTIASNPYLAEAWLTDFNGIMKANEVLYYLGQNGDVITNTTQRNNYEGEARFLRAFYYFDLVRLFGQVPVIDKITSATETLQIPRSEAGAVYDLIISDLKFSADNLAASYTGVNVGRASSFVAKAMLALVYMTRSGPGYDVKGAGLGMNEWNLALPLLTEVLASPNYTFISDYKSIFSYSNENNKEVIFDIQFISGGLGLGALYPSIMAPDNYFAGVGIPFPAGLDIRPVSNDLLNSYEAGDIRKAFNFQIGYTAGGISEARAFERKYLNESGRGKDRTDWPVNFILMRYTDVLLLKAECILHGAAGSQTEVDNAVNQVRQRAGLGTVANVTLPQLMEERRREFAGEGLRWNDLVRSGLVETIMPAWIAKEDIQKKMQAFNKNYIIYPIPTSELNVMQGLYQQNTGY